MNLDDDGSKSNIVNEVIDVDIKAKNAENDAEMKQVQDETMKTKEKEDGQAGEDK